MYVNKIRPCTFKFQLIQEPQKQFKVRTFHIEMASAVKRGSTSTEGSRRQTVKEPMRPIRRERDVGILHHVSNHLKFEAVVKERYSDFHVNEIDPQGQVVHLTSYELPKDAREEVDESDPIFSKWVSKEVRSAIKSLNTEANPTQLQKKNVDINVTECSKEERTKIHRWLANYEMLSSETVEKSDQKFVVVSRQRSKGKGSRYTRRPANRGKYTHCVLYKEGIDTSDAIGYLARKLQLRPNFISYAGTKDKQAKTTQRICFSNIDASRLLELNKYSTFSRLGNFEYQAQKLNLGDSLGNHFKLLLKNVLADSDAVVRTAVDNLKTTGFINYFGLQRFGSYSVPTHKIGKAVIQMNYLEAFDLILQPKPNDPEFLAAAKKIWFSEKNPEDAVKFIPSWCRTPESNLLHGLSKHYAQNDYQNAFSYIPRNMRLFYLHAYQSYMWNRLASYRIKEYGLVPAVGDLVYLNPQELEVSIEAQDIVDEMDVTDMNSTPVKDSSNTELKRTGEIPKVKVLMSEDLANYTIYDIVIPLEGTKIQHPANKVKDYSEQLLLEGGIGADLLQKFRARPDTPKGAYRKLVVIPKNVSYKILSYSDVDNLDAFIPSDLDLLEKPAADKLFSELKSEDSMKEKKCIILEFSLPSSSYATMALREILRGEEPMEHIEPENATKNEIDDQTQDEDNIDVKKAKMITKTDEI